MVEHTLLNIIVTRLFSGHQRDVFAQALFVFHYYHVNCVKLEDIGAGGVCLIPGSNGQDSWSRSGCF